MITYNKIRKNEKSVLETFQAEIPSVYYSDKTEEDYLAYKLNAEYTYRNLLKFPPEMFNGKRLIDFGAGTGENTVYLASWGAICTLVEMNMDAQSISKRIFEKYTENYREHKFIKSSIFDFDVKELYQSFDIVHCRGVLSHTADKKGAFDIITKYLKPGGYLIYGDPNKSGSFQNMLQRFTIYSFAKTWEEMVAVSEELFKDDIDRSQRFVPRSRRTIIFDRWVVQKQDDPSISEVMKWFEINGLTLYSSHPPFLIPFLSNSVHHEPKFDVKAFKEIGSLSEAIWMTHNQDDMSEIPKMLHSLGEFSLFQDDLVSYIADSDLNMKVNLNEFKDKAHAYMTALGKLDLTSYLYEKTTQLLLEAEQLITLVLNGNLAKVKCFIDQSEYIFRGANGVRHVDFVSYKSR